MIDYIKGEIAELTPTYVVLETGNIGYSIQITLPTYSAFAEQKTVKLFVYEAIREDAHILYGFRTQKERQLFLLLISVTGIGANTARMIMSSYSVEEISQMIATANAVALSSIKGIGTKTAQRIIVDLKDKITKVVAVENYENLTTVNAEIKQEAVAAMVMLGFSSVQTQKVVDKILKDNPNIDVEQTIKQALKMM